MNRFNDLLEIALTFGSASILSLTGIAAFGFVL
jgi:hypothetical protein